MEFLLSHFFGSILIAALGLLTCSPTPQSGALQNQFSAHSNSMKRFVIADQIILDLDTIKNDWSIDLRVVDTSTDFDASICAEGRFVCMPKIFISWMDPNRWYSPKDMPNDMKRLMECSYGTFADAIEFKKNLELSVFNYGVQEPFSIESPMSVDTVDTQIGEFLMVTNHAGMDLGLYDGVMEAKAWALIQDREFIISFSDIRKGPFTAGDTLRALLTRMQIVE